MLHIDILMHNENKGFESINLDTLLFFFFAATRILYIISDYLDKKQSK